MRSESTPATLEIPCMACCIGLPMPGIKETTFPTTSPTDWTTLSPNLTILAPVVLTQCPTFLAANIIIEVRIRNLAFIHLLVSSPVLMPFQAFCATIDRWEINNISRTFGQLERTVFNCVSKFLLSSNQYPISYFIRERVHTWKPCLIALPAFYCQWIINLLSYSRKGIIPGSHAWLRPRLSIVNELSICYHTAEKGLYLEAMLDCSPGFLLNQYFISYCRREKGLGLELTWKPFLILCPKLYFQSNNQYLTSCCI